MERTLENAPCRATRCRRRTRHRLLRQTRWCTAGTRSRFLRQSDRTACKCSSWRPCSHRYAKPPPAPADLNSVLGKGAVVGAEDDDDDDGDGGDDDEDGAQSATPNVKHSYSYSTSSGSSGSSSSSRAGAVVGAGGGPISPAEKKKLQVSSPDDHRLPPLTTPTHGH